MAENKNNKIFKTCQIGFHLFLSIFHLICVIVKKHLSANNPKQRQIQGICLSPHFINEIVCPFKRTDF